MLRFLHELRAEQAFVGVLSQNWIVAHLTLLRGSSCASSLFDTATKSLAFQAQWR